MRSAPVTAAGHDLIVHTVDDNGNPRPGWYRIRADQRVSFYEELLERGLAARRVLPSTSLKRAEIEDSLAELLKRPGTVPPGPYPNIDGTMTIVERATVENLHAASARDQLARRRLGPLRG